MKPIILFSLLTSAQLPFRAWSLVLPSMGDDSTMPDLGNPHIRCLPMAAFQTDFVPHLDNCAKALSRWPTGSQTINFKRAVPPPAQSYRDCLVHVDLKRGQRSAKVSWVEIGLAATQVAMACLGTEGGFAGERTEVGEDRMIEIFVRPFNRQALGNSSTAVGTSLQEN